MRIYSLIYSKIEEYLIKENVRETVKYIIFSIFKKKILCFPMIIILFIYNYIAIINLFIEYCTYNSRLLLLCIMLYG